MPYVEVWVDESDIDSKEIDRLEAIIDEAATLLRDGEIAAALHALTGDVATNCKHPAKIAKDYEAWKAGKLRGFTNFHTEKRGQGGH